MAEKKAAEEAAMKGPWSELIALSVASTHHNLFELCFRRYIYITDWQANRLL
jgi:hypothetical protein